MSLRGGSAEYLALLYTSYTTCTEHKLDRGLSLFSDIPYLITFKKQMNRLSKGKDAHIRHTSKAVQLSQNRTYEMFVAS